MLALVILEGVVIALLAVLVIGLLRSHAEVLRRLHELGAGVYDEDEGSAGASAGANGNGASVSVPFRTQPGVPEPRTETSGAHDIVGTTPDGGAAVAGVVGVGHTTLLAFLTSGCATCQNFWQAFGSGAADQLPGRDTRLVVVTAGDDRESAAAVRSLAPRRHTTIMSSNAWDDYHVPVSPYFILVDGASSRVVGEGAAATWDQVANLLGQAAADAGITPDGAPVVSARPAGRLNGPQRLARAEAELAAAGIEPGHPSLYPEQVATDVGADAEAEGR